MNESAVSLARYFGWVVISVVMWFATAFVAVAYGKLIVALWRNL